MSEKSPVVNPRNRQFYSSMERARKSSVEEQNVDRLSALPDGIICHILSFLKKTKSSVQTSILAKRWRFLWAHVPVLAFESWHFVSEQATCFPSIVCTVMLRHKVQSLNTFHLLYTDDDGPTGCYELETCIATAIERNVQNLYLHLEVELPRCCLTCKTLVDMRISRGVSIPSSGPISLPSLKKLYIFSFEDDVRLPHLLSGCPVLEELTIGRIPCFSLWGCTISSPTLKRLTLNLPAYEKIAFDIPDYRLRINAPTLTYLTVDGYMYHHISVSPMNSLVEASICLDPLGVPDELYPRCVLEFLDSLYNVKSLDLECEDRESYNLPGSIVKFGNLTQLDLDANWRFLSIFLESADHLEVLIIRGDLDSDDWVEPIEKRCACLLYSLRIVRIYGFPPRQEQRNKMVRYILRNALVLEHMEINGKVCDRENFIISSRVYGK